MKGSSAPAEVESAATTIRRLGGVDPQVLTVGDEWLTPPVTVVRIGKSDNTGQKDSSAKRRSRRE
jgi:hypothetical protein